MMKKYYSYNKSFNSVQDVLFRKNHEIKFKKWFPEEHINACDIPRSGYAIAYCPKKVFPQSYNINSMIAEMLILFHSILLFILERKYVVSKRMGNNMSSPLKFSVEIVAFKKHGSTIKSKQISAREIISLFCG